MLRVKKIVRISDDVNAKIITNYGISNDLKIKLPFNDAPSLIFFGNPTNYQGEYHTLLLVQQLLPFSNAFIDVGANWGYYTWWAATYRKNNQPIYSFEPNQMLYSVLTDNVNTHEFTHIHISNKAVGDITGEVCFYEDTGSDLTSSLVPSSGNSKPVYVPCTRFDDWLIQHPYLNNLLVKVDVENAEWQFINGAIGGLDKISFLVMEVLGPARQSGFINYMINDLGFKAYYINGKNIEYVTAEDMRYTAPEYNWLFCKLNPEQLKKKINCGPLKIINS